MLLAALVGLVTIAAIVAWQLVGQRERLTGSRRRRVAWLIVLLVAIGAYIPGPAQYGAIAVLLFGPGAHSKYFQRSAAMADSIILLSALRVRGATLEPDLLGFAAYHGSTAVVRRLLAFGAPVNEAHFESKVTALHKAVEGRQYDSARLLLDAGARSDLPNAKGLTPLDMAKASGDPKMLELLLEKPRR